MAFNLKYANFDLTTGDNDGTSEANAWQAHTDVSLSAGDWLYVKKTASRYSAGGIWSISGSPTTDAPIMVEGYGTTPGDGVRFEMDTGVNMATSIPLLNFDVAVTSAQNCFDTASNGNFINCKFESNTSRISSSLESRTRFLNCEFVFSAGVGTAITVSVQCQFHGCTFVAGSFVSQAFVRSAGATTFTDCTFLCEATTGNRIALTCTSPNADLLVFNCSFKNWSRIVNTDGSGGGGPGTAGGLYLGNIAVEDCVNIYVADFAGNNTNFQIHNLLHDGNLSAVGADASTSRDFMATNVIDAGADVFVDAANGDFTLADPATYGDVLGGGFAMPFGVASLGADTSGGGGGGAGLAPSNFGLLPVNKTSEVS